MHKTDIANYEENWVSLILDKIIYGNASI